VISLDPLGDKSKCHNTKAVFYSKVLGAILGNFLRILNNSQVFLNFGENWVLSSVCPAMTTQVTVEDHLFVLTALGGKDGEKFAQKFRERDAAAAAMREKIPKRHMAGEFHASLRHCLETYPECCFKLPDFVRKLERKYEDFRRKEPDKYPHRESVEAALQKAMMETYWLDDPELGTRFDIPAHKVFRTIENKYTEFTIPSTERSVGVYAAWSEVYKGMKNTLTQGLVSAVITLGYHFPEEFMNFFDSFEPPGKYNLLSEPLAIYKSQHAGESHGKEPGSTFDEKTVEGIPTKHARAALTEDRKNDLGRAKAKLLTEMTSNLAEMGKSIEQISTSFKGTAQKYETVLDLVNIQQRHAQLMKLVETLNQV
jgi:hypothetical protein